MLTATTIETVKATVPVLAAQGLRIVERFYQRLFQAHPELQNVFNMRHQQSGEQQRALTHAVYAYASNIDNLGALGPAVARITHKHASVNVVPAQYAVVGEHLLGAMQDVLGAAATPAILGAWGEAYGLLAQLMIDTEARLYDEAAARPGGWRGWREFVVAHKRKDSDVITSFFLEPRDGGTLSDFKPGQYVSLLVDLPDRGLQQVRQYSLSDAPNGRYYRITIKREDDVDGAAALGLAHISNLLHARLDKGSVLKLTPPFGEFVVDLDATSPVVLISGGVGMTALVSMMKALLRDTAREVVFVHGARNGSVHGMKDRIRAVAETNRRLQSIVFYEDPLPGDDLGYDYHHAGRINLAQIAGVAVRPDADYYLCGPVPFIRAQVQSLKSLGVGGERIHYEVFGSDAGQI